MMRAAATMRWLAVTAILVGLLSPISTLQAIAQESTGTGSLVINLSDSVSGAAIGGASYDVTDANGATQSVADGAGSGSVQVDGLAAGTATVTQTGTASGYDLSGGSVEIVGGATATLNLFNTQLVTETPPPPDFDGDSVSDDVDNCFDIANPDQANTYGGWLGDACEAPPPPDTDGDGFADDADNCLDVANDQTDSDGDGVGDACEPVEAPVDTDADGVADDADNCPNVANSDQADADGDGAGDACAPVEVPTAEPTEEATETPEKGKNTSSLAAALALASGDASNNFKAAIPGTYDPVSGAIAGGSFAQSREELESEDLTCGQAVVFYDGISVDSGANGTYGVDFTFDRESTNHILIGFGAFLGASVQTGDPFNANLDGNEVATGSASIDADSVNVHVDITNLQAGEKVVVRIVVQLICREDLAGRQGNVQSRLGSGGGAQTIPLKLVGATPPAPPEISVVKNCPTGAVNEPGGTIIYKIDITNVGLQTVYIKNGGLVDTRTGTFHSDAAGTVALTYPIQINPGVTVSVYFKTTVLAADITNGNVNNTITVTAVSDIIIQDPLTISQTATATCPITRPNLTITKTPDAAEVDAGDPIGFVITVTSTGPGTATSVQVTDNLPTNPGLSWSENSADCSIASGVLTCNFGNMAPGTSKSVHITSPTTGGTCPTVENTATVTSTNALTKTASSAITVICTPAIEIVKTATDGTNEITEAGFGDTITYVYKVKNTGNVDLTDVTVVDDNGTPGDTGDDQTCVIGDLAAGATDTSCSFDHVVTIANAIAGSIHNIAVVTGTPPAGPDVTDEDDATVEIVINPLLSLTVECPQIPDGAKAGDPVIFSLHLTNNGDVPIGSLVATSGHVGTFSAIPNLDPGDTEDFTFTTTLTAAEVLAGLVSLDVDIDGFFASLLVEVSGGTECSFQPFVDLAITKIADDPEVTAGDPIGFTIEVENLGEGIAHGVVIDDILPGQGNLLWDVDPDDPNCDLLDVHLICDAGDLDPGDTYSVHVVADTTAEDCGTVENTATVAYDDDRADLTLFTVELNDPQENNTATATVDVLCPNVVVTKTADDGEINSGDEIGFTITVANTGEGVAHDVVLKDQLEAGLTWVEDPDTLCEIDALNLLTCEIGDLAPGDPPFVVHVTATATALLCPAIENTASVSASNEPEAQWGDNTSTASVTVNCPDVSIEKKGENVNAGEDLFFTIIVHNGGPGDAYDVVITDDLPAGLDWFEDTDLPECEIKENGDDEVLTCTIDVLSAATDFEVTVGATTTPENCGPVSNTATVTLSNDHPRSDPAPATSEVEILCPDVKVTKEADAAEVLIGDPVGFTITVENIGAGVASNVTLDDELDSRFAWVEDPDNPDCEIASSILHCEFGDLALGETREVHVTAPTDPQETLLDDCGLLENTAMVTADNEPAPHGADLTLFTVEDPREDNSDTATIFVDCPAITIDKIATSDGTTEITEANLGDTITYVYEVTNTGNVELTAITVFDDNATPGDTSDDVELTGCEIALLAVGASTTCELDHLVTEADWLASPITNIAKATGTPPLGPDVTDTDDATVAITAPDLDVTKQANSYAVNAGDPIIFTLTVENTGDGVAHGVILEDVLPANLAFTGLVFVSQGSCGFDGVGTLTCSFGNIAPGGSATLVFRATAIAGECEAVLNSATTEAGNEPQVLLTNNTATITIDVFCPDVTVIKTADAEEVTVGDEVGFTISVDNIGEGVAHDVVLNDGLAAGLIWIEDPDNPDCEIAANLLHCEFGDLAPAALPVEVHITAISTDEFCRGIDNTATVTSANEPGALVGNNEGSAFVEVDCPEIEIVKTVTDGALEITEAQIGDTIIYKYEVTNTGDVDLHDVTVVDDNGTPAILLDDFTCVIGDLPVGAVDTSCEQDHVVTVADAFASPIINVAVVTGKSPLDVEVSDDDDAEIEIIANPHLTITLGCPVIEGIGHVGDDVTFAINVLNDGDVPLINLLAISSSHPGGLFSALPPDLDPGEGANITFTTQISAAEALLGLISFQVNVNGAFLSTIVDVNGGQDCEFTPFVNVAVTKTADVASVTAPDPIGFTIEVTNAGESTATDVTLNDPLPQGDILAWTMDPDNADCAIDGSGVLTCDFGDLAIGDTRTVHVVANSDFENCDELTNTVTIAASNESPGEDADNTASADTDVNCPDMTVQADPDSPVVTSGDPIGFTITGSNIGEGQARGATLTAPLPAGLTWTIDGPPSIASSVSEGPSGAFLKQGISAAQIDCVPSGNVINCTFEDMDPGVSISFHVTATSDPEFCGTLETAPTVAATNEPSTALANNGGFAFLVTVACPQVSVNKVADAETANSGEDIGFTITVSNQVGEGEAVGVTLTDTLPTNPGLDWSIDGGSNASDCGIAAGELTCDFGSLLDGEVVDVHITSPTVENETCGLVTNTAVVHAINEEEEDLADNESTDSVEVGCVQGAGPEIDIVKTATDGNGNEITEVNAGDTITYIFTVTNISDVDLDEIVVVDDNLTPSDTSDDITLACPATGLAPGESMECSLTHVVSEDEADGETLTNVAVVTAHDPNDEEVTDADDATVTVDEPGEPVTELPNTGQGEIARRDDTSWLLILSLTTMLGGTAYALRRRRAA